MVLNVVGDEWVTSLRAIDDCYCCVKSKGFKKEEQA